MPMILILAIAAIGGAVFFFAELATTPMRTRRNLVHRAANYGRLRTVTGKEIPGSASVRSTPSWQKRPGSCFASIRVFPLRRCRTS